MGDWTELNISVKLRTSIDADTITLLNYMTSKDTNRVFMGRVPSHPFFHNSFKWKTMLTDDSFYFDHSAESSLVDKTPEEVNPEWKIRVLNVRCDTKNSYSEIDFFLDWLYGIAETRGFIGYVREEESDPRLIYFTGDGIRYGRTHVEEGWK